MPSVQKTIFRRAHESNFVTVGNDVARDASLSHRARGVLLWLLSCPPNWDIHISTLCTPKESRTAINTAIEELENTGYVVRQQARNKEGHFQGGVFLVYETPVALEHRSNPLLRRHKKNRKPPFASHPKTDEPKTDEPFSVHPQLQRKTPTKTESYKDIPQGGGGNAPTHTSELEALPAQDRPAIYTVYEQEFGPLSPMIAERLGELVSEYTEAWVAAAIRESVVGGARKLAYAEAVLKNWAVNGYGARPAKATGRAPVAVHTTGSTEPRTGAPVSTETLRRQLDELKRPKRTPER